MRRPPCCCRHRPCPRPHSAGLVAHEGGSVLQVKINTQLASKPASETRVYLSYLATYGEGHLVHIHM